MKKNIFALGLFPGLNQVLYKNLSDNFNLFVFKNHFFQNPNNLNIKYVEDIVDDNDNGQSVDFMWDFCESGREIEGLLNEVFRDGGVDTKLTLNEFGLYYKSASRMYSSAHIFKKLLKKVNIDLVLVNSDYSGLRRPVVIEAKLKGIPVLDIEHGFFAMEPEKGRVTANFVDSMPFISDYVNLDNKIEKNIWESYYGVESDVKFIANGTPNDISFNTEISNKEAREFLNIDPERFTIMLAGSWVEARLPSNLIKAQIEQVEFYKSVLESIGKYPRKDVIQVVIKLHPAYANDTVYKDCCEFLTNLMTENSIPYYLITVFDLDKVLAASEIVICSSRSSLIWEALLAGLPSYIYAAQISTPYLVRENDVNIEETLNNSNVLFKSGAAKYLRDGTQLHELLDTFFDKKNRKKHKDLIKKLIAENDINCLSTSEKSKNIVDWILQFLNDPDNPNQKQHDMNIIRICVNPVCTGPINYLIQWQCAVCSHLNEFEKRVSLLSEQQLACSHCDEINNYKYNRAYFKSPRPTDEIMEIEEHILFHHKMKHRPPIQVLGQDFIFTVNTYISQLLAEHE